jgi:mannosyltransferase OCH1-like enzyme
MINIARYLASRIIKLFGNCLKGICYLFYFVFPKKRFVIPRCSKPILNIDSGHLIPKIIWQTNYTESVTLAVYLNYLFNRIMSPTYRYRFMDGDERRSFVKSYYSSKIFESYSKLQIGAAQADFWRVLVLQKFGGVYLDIDAHVVWPMGFIIKPEHKELFLLHKNDELTNYFIASTNDNPNLDRIVSSILKNIENGTSKEVSELTGPAMLHRSLSGQRLIKTYYKYTCYQGTFTNEFFQYLDHPQGKWTSAQKIIDVIKR